MFNSSPCTWKHLKCLKCSSPRPPPNTKTEMQKVDCLKISIWQLQISHIHRTSIKRGRTLAVVISAHRSRNGWGVLDSWSICDLSQLTSTLGQIAKTPQPFQVTCVTWTIPDIIFAILSGISATFSGTIASFVQTYLLFTFSAPPFLPPQSPRRCILLPLIIIHRWWGEGDVPYCLVGLDIPCQTCACLCQNILKGFLMSTCKIVICGSFAGTSLPLQTLP